jgi:hypothetical protein
MKVRGTKKLFEELDNSLIRAKSLTEKKLETRIVTDLREATPVDTGEARDGWRSFISPSGLTVYNEVEHIDRLNSGSSQQAPAHFIESTVMAVPGVKAKNTIVRNR